MTTSQTLNKEQAKVYLLLVMPIEKIISQIENSEFRDCDIKWLDQKLDNYMNVAASLNGIKSISQHESVKPKFMDRYAKEYYNNYFKSILDYFKSLI